jgi:hypothetical protein
MIQLARQGFQRGVQRAQVSDPTDRTLHGAAHGRFYLKGVPMQATIILPRPLGQAMGGVEQGGLGNFEDGI